MNISKPILGTTAKLAAIILVISLLFAGLVQAQEAYRVTFTVYTGDVPVANALIELDGYLGQYTNDNGQTTFSGVAPADSIFYRVSKVGYNPFSDSVKVTNADVTEMLNLNLAHYTVTFNLSEMPLYFSGATIQLEKNGSLNTDPAGTAVFTNVAYDTLLHYTITSTAFNSVTGNITPLVSDTLITYTLTPQGYYILFRVSSNDQPIEHATVTLGSMPPKETDAKGEVAFTGLEAAQGIPYTITKPGFFDYADVVTIYNQNVIMPVSIIPVGYAVTFKIEIGNTPQVGVSVMVDNAETNYTDKNGLARFANISGNTQHDYIISHPNLVTKTGTFNITSDTTLSVSVVVGLDEESINTSFVFPNPAHEYITLSAQQPALYQIYNMNSILEMQVFIDNSGGIIDVSNLAPGVYIIKQHTPQMFRQQKLIIEN